jgi:hypothetical protein
MPPLRRALLAALLLVPIAYAPSVAAACTLAPGPDGWGFAKPDPFAAGGDALSALALLPRHPETIVVTNGVSVQVTNDGGCEWATATLPAAGLLGLGTDGRAIVDVEASQVRDGVEPVWVLAQEKGTLARPAVFRSGDQGGSFAATGELPPTGTARALAAGGDEATAYVVLDLPAPLGRRLYATLDGGASWNAAAPTGAEFPYDNVAVDTIDPTLVWAWDDDTLASSHDGGATFLPADVPGDGAIRDVALGQSARGSRLAVLRENGLLLRSDDGGKEWTRSRVDITAEQVAAAPDLDVTAVAGPGDPLPGGVVTVLPSVFKRIDLSPGGAEPLDLSVALLPGNAYRVAGRRDDRVMTYVGAVLRGASEFDLSAAAKAIPVDPQVLPRRATVTLAPGESKVVDYELDVPARPSPVEVFFLIDTTGSMGGVIDGVRQGLAKIVNDLAKAGIQARFGVGEVKDYPFAPYSSPPDLPYRLFRAVGPVDDELASALDALVAGGGGDGPESMTTGLYQLASGVGEVVNEIELVPPGDDARFDPDLLNVVLASTDTTYHKEATFPGPSMEKAHAALRRKGIKVIGLAAGTDAVGDLMTTAEETRTYAPKGGTDCDLDGKVDVQEGQPLVCLITGGATVNIGAGGIVVDTAGSKGIAPAIVSLLRGIRDPARLSLRSSRPDVAEVLGAAPVLDLKSAHAVPYRVRLSCPAALYGSTVAATLTGLAGARPLATGDVSVRCLAPPPPPRGAPVPAEVPVTVVLQKPPVAAAAIPPAPPVQPVQNVNPNAQINPNANAQLQAGAVQQRQEQVHLALATDEFTDPEVELAMTGHEPPAVLVPAIAAMMAAAAASAAAFRTRPAPAAVTVRRRRRP